MEIDVYLNTTIVKVQHLVQIVYLICVSHLNTTIVKVQQYLPFK